MPSSQSCVLTAAIAQQKVKLDFWYHAASLESDVLLRISPAHMQTRHILLNAGEHYRVNQYRTTEWLFGPDPFMFKCCC